MRYLAAYLLLVEGGNATPSLDDLKSIIESVGVEFETSRAKALLSALEGKTVEELIAEGSSKFGALPSGGAASGASASSAGAAGAATEEAAEEKEESEAEESDDDMGFGLFD